MPWITPALYQKGITACVTQCAEKVGDRVVPTLKQAIWVTVGSALAYFGYKTFFDK